MSNKRGAAVQGMTKLVHEGDQSAGKTSDFTDEGGVPEYHQI